MTRAAGTRSSRNSNKSSPPKVDRTRVIGKAKSFSKETHQAKLMPTEKNYESVAPYVGVCTYALVLCCCCSRTNLVHRQHGRTSYMDSRATHLNRRVETEGTGISTVNHGGSVGKIRSSCRQSTSLAICDLVLHTRIKRPRQTPKVKCGPSTSITAVHSHIDGMNLCVVR